jgi:hypothetical protein
MMPDTTDTAAALEQLVFRLEEALRNLYRGSTALPGLAAGIEDLFRDPRNDDFVEEDGEHLRSALAKLGPRVADFDLHVSELQDVAREVDLRYLAIIKSIPGLMDEHYPVKGERWDSLPDVQ